MANAAENAQFELEVGDAEETEVEVPASEEENTQEVEEVSVSEDSAPGAEAEMEQYSESVQKRINRLTKKMRDAEREREEALVHLTCPNLIILLQLDAALLPVLQLDLLGTIETNTRHHPALQLDPRDIPRSIETSTRSHPATQQCENKQTQVNFIT